MKPDSRELEFNEATWWSKWVEAKWVGEGSFVLSSSELPEYFFNRAGFLDCGAASHSISNLEHEFASTGRPAVFFVQEGCPDLIASMATHGYAEFERMSVMFLAEGRFHPSPLVDIEKVNPASADAWADTFLDSFGYGAELRPVLSRIAERLAVDSAVTLLLGRVGGEPAGTVALYRSDKLLGAYCVGTRPDHRKVGVASSLLAAAESIAASEARTLTLQTLASDRAEAFYEARGFARVYSKLGLRKESPDGDAGASVTGLDLGVSIARGARGFQPFNSVFTGFERVGAVKAIFGERTEQVLSGLMVDVKDDRGYLHIDDERGCVMVNAKYLSEGSERSIYLDVVHELVHIKQHLEGRELFDRTYKYVDRPTELEAYDVTVREARRIGMKDGEIAEYLRVEWVTEEDFRRFLTTLAVRP